MPHTPCNIPHALCPLQETFIGLKHLCSIHVARIHPLFQWWVDIFALSGSAECPIDMIWAQLQAYKVTVAQAQMLPWPKACAMLHWYALGLPRPAPCAQRPVPCAQCPAPQEQDLQNLPPFLTASPLRCQEQEHHDDDEDSESCWGKGT